MSSYPARHRVVPWRPLPPAENIIKDPYVTDEELERSLQRILTLYRGNREPHVGSGAATVGATLGRALGNALPTHYQTKDDYYLRKSHDPHQYKSHDPHQYRSHDSGKYTAYDLHSHKAPDYSSSRVYDTNPLKSQDYSNNRSRLYEITNSPRSYDFSRSHDIPSEPDTRKYNGYGSFRTYNAGTYKRYNDNDLVKTHDVGTVRRYQESGSQTRATSRGAIPTFTNQSSYTASYKKPFESQRTSGGRIHAGPAIGTDEYYIRKIQDILYVPAGSQLPGSPTQLNDFLFIGGYRDAENHPYLRRLGITHVLNCAAWRRVYTNPYPAGSGIVGYEQFEAEDEEGYNVMQHFPKAKAFIDRAKYSGGKCLVHCAMGINRSGTMCAAYMMMDQKRPILDVIKSMKAKRGTVLCNRGFQRQLVKYARSKGFL